jgi:hypothetical protein
MAYWYLRKKHFYINVFSFACQPITGKLTYQYHNAYWTQVHCTPYQACVTAPPESFALCVYPIHLAAGSAPNIEWINAMVSSFARFMVLNGLIRQ